MWYLNEYVYEKNLLKKMPISQEERKREVIKDLIPSEKEIIEISVEEDQNKIN
jgi:hypothetical protein